LEWALFIEGQQKLFFIPWLGKNYLWLIILCKEALVRKFFSADLAPTARGTTKIYYPLDSIEDLKEIVDLKELIS
jgi:hypothetical protein